jgi:hypothetical protein
MNTINREVDSSNWFGVLVVLLVKRMVLMLCINNLYMQGVHAIIGGAWLLETQKNTLGYVLG